MKNRDKAITITERLASGFWSAFFMLITSIVFFFGVIVMTSDIESPTALGNFVRSYFWHIVFYLSGGFGVLGFFVGSKNIAEIFSWLWGTKKHQ